MPYAIMVSHGADRENRVFQPTDIIFENGAEAGAYVKSENMYTGRWGGPRFYKAVKISDDDPMAWRFRITKQLEEGVFQRSPWYDYYGTGSMYDHIDPDDGTKIRFFANEDHGMAGRYTSMAPGRFVRRYLDSCVRPDLMDQWCAAMGIDEEVTKLLIARTPEEVVRVYNEGPHSCMAYQLSREDGPFQHLDVHPVACYGDSDIGVAYIERGGEITARCLVWPDKKLHGRIYGDRHRLLERLKENDYVEEWDFVGAKIRQLRSRSQLVLPYIDGDLGVVKKGRKWLILTEEPHIIGKSPDGVPSAESCSSCEKTDVPLMAYRDDPDDEYQYVCSSCC